MVLTLSIQVPFNHSAIQPMCSICNKIILGSHTQTLPFYGTFQHLGMRYLTTFHHCTTTTTLNQLNHNHSTSLLLLLVVHWINSFKNSLWSHTFLTQYHSQWKFIFIWWNFSSERTFILLSLISGLYLASTMNYDMRSGFLVLSTFRQVAKSYLAIPSQALMCLAHRDDSHLTS